MNRALKRYALCLAAAGALTVVGFVSTALADSITVDFGQGSYNVMAQTLSGSQVTTTADNGDLTGTYVASGGTFGSDFCLHGVTTRLDYPGTATIPTLSGITLVVDKFCFNNGFSGNFSVVTGSGSGAFDNASGAGSVIYNRPDDVTFNATSGRLDPPPGLTPELDSLVLFGTGSLGLGGYALMRLRARRKGRSV
jgi:hypothetical protein